MSEPGVPGHRPSERLDPERRDKVLDLLSSYFTAGRIELEDMERRMEIAARADTAAQLDAALEGLRDVPAVREDAAPAPAAHRPGERRRTLAFLAGLQRRGPWRPGPRHTVMALLGGVQLDFRDAELAPGTTDVSLWVMWGGVEIVVPPDLDVEVDGAAIMGGVNELSQHPAGATARRLRVRARVLMGGVEVKVQPR